MHSKLSNTTIFFIVKIIWWQKAFHWATIFSFKILLYWDFTYGFKFSQVHKFQRKFYWREDVKTCIKIFCFVIFIIPNKLPLLRGFLEQSYHYFHISQVIGYNIKHGKIRNSTTRTSVAEKIWYRRCLAIGYNPSLADAFWWHEN